MTTPREPPDGPEPARPSGAPGAGGHSDRGALLRAAGEQFAEMGYVDASLARILVRAGRATGAPEIPPLGKRELAEWVMDEAIDRKLGGFSSAVASAPDPLTAVISGVAAVVELSVRDPVVRGGNRLLDDPSISGEHAVRNYQLGERALDEGLAAAVAQGLLRSDLDHRELARSLTTSVVGHRLICHRTNTLDDLPARVSRMWQAMLPLIRA
ncbi:MAG TPA: hypothetical protein VGH99_17975 [Pseudonocardia sp.]